jgi:hypothetical protein
MFWLTTVEERRSPIAYRSSFFRSSKSAVVYVAFSTRQENGLTEHQTAIEPHERADTAKPENRDRYNPAGMALFGRNLVDRRPICQCGAWSRRMRTVEVAAGAAARLWKTAFGE